MIQTFRLTGGRKLPTISLHGQPNRALSGDPRKLGRCARLLLQRGNFLPRRSGVPGAKFDMATTPASTVSLEGFRLNRPSATFDPKHDLPPGFVEFLAP